ncbi:hypothetical protein D0Z03_000904 [Geotrichum reessii]|nr:hypothetical protein D0Z03_000904 [Galactomyces reessii]
MPMIYRRFTEKSANEWRQIYKALQLLEYLIKNGSERVVDYARSHVAVIDMLKNFHYINSEGKDQGINVRNRAKELVALLNDVSKIRAERKSAKAKKVKYTGSGSNGFGGTGKKYGGFGSDSPSGDYGGYSGGVYGDGGGFGGNEYEGPGYSRSSRAHATEDDEFEEYQVEGVHNSSSRSTAAESQPAPKTAAPQVDLFSFDDPVPVPAATTPTAPVDDDDEFDDFQSAGPVAASSTLNTSKPLPTTNNNNLFDLFSSPAPTNTSSNNTFSSFTSAPTPVTSGFGSFSSAPLSSASTTLGGTTSTINGGNKGKAPAKNDAFGDLWSSTKKTATANKPKPAETSNNNSGSLI